LKETMTTALESQIEDFKTQARSQLEQHLARGLEPSARSANPYNPIDRALKKIKMEITKMVTTAFTKIDEVIRGTVDQAVEDIRLSTRHSTSNSTTPNPQGMPIPAVTPERTFRGRTVRIEEPPPNRETYLAGGARHDEAPPRRTERDNPYHEDRQAERHEEYGGQENYRSSSRSHYNDYDRTSRDEYRSQREQESFLKGHVEASLESLKEDDMIVWYKSFESYCSLHNVPLLTFHQVTKGTDLYPSSQPTSERPRFSRIISLKLNQIHLIKDPTAKSIKNARVGRDDGYGALYALLAATIPRLQVNKIAPKTGSNKPPEWDPSTMNLYHYESKIQDYAEFQATKRRHYNEREEALFFLEGLSTDESQRFKTALTTIMDKLDKIEEGQDLPMDDKLGLIAQTVAELAQSDTDVGQDALVILTTATVRTATGNDEPMVHYSRDGRQDGRSEDKRYDKNARRGGQMQQKPRRPKMEIQCHSCKLLWGHEESHCDHLAKTMFAIDYAKKNADKAEKVC
jgi:hypothetical protein